MKRYAAQFFAVILGAFVVTATFLESEAEARAGRGGSFGSRGSRSYSRPAPTSPYRQAAPSPMPSSPTPFRQPQQGGFFRGMMGGVAGGLLGGMIGGMLFRGMGFAGPGAGYGGPGLFDILLLAGIGYLIYRFVKKRREAQPAYQSYGPTSTSGQPDYQQPQSYSYGSAAPAYDQPHDDTAAGLAHIRQMDYGFDEGRFKDTVMDLFFKVQGAWMNRDLGPVAGILTTEMQGILQQDVQRLIAERRINRLENIAVRSVEITEAWQESGNDFITALVYANLLDYTTDETGNVLDGSKTDPVKFEEYWTFTRPVGDNPWKLSAIQQA